MGLWINFVKIIKNPMGQIGPKSLQKLAFVLYDELNWYSLFIGTAVGSFIGDLGLPRMSQRIKLRIL